MTVKSQKQNDSTAQITVEDVENYDELTELDYEQATDELKLRHCAEVHSGKDFRNVLDADELLTVKIGDEYIDTFNTSDERTTVQVHKFAEKFVLTYEDYDTIRHVVTDEKPEASDVADAIDHSVEFFMTDKDMSADDCIHVYENKEYDNIEQDLIETFEN